MADIVTLGDVSTKDTGSGSQLKTGGRRKHNMPKKCVEMKMKGGMSRAAAVKACYPKMGEKFPSKKQVMDQGAKRAIDKIKKTRKMAPRPKGY